MHLRCAGVAAVPWWLQRRRRLPVLLVLLLVVVPTCVVSFQPKPSSSSSHSRRHRRRGSLPAPQAAALSATATSLDDDAAVSKMQWALLLKHHAQPDKAVVDRHNKMTVWKGIWTTYDDMGNVIVDSVASVNYHYDDNENTVAVSHSIVTNSVQSDCATCHDDEVTQTFPVATYTSTNLASKRVTLGACGMVIGPSVLARTGAGTCTQSSSACACLEQGGRKWWCQGGSNRVPCVCALSQ
jgi:hypothetical protein